MEQLKSPAGIPPPGPVPTVGRSVAVTRLREELREVAWDLVGRPARDELSDEDLQRLADELDDAVETVLSELVGTLERDLQPRVESLPLRARLRLANLRLRHQLGYD
jgi:hypothetical protein